MVEARYANQPIIPMSLLRNRTVTASCLAALFESMAMYTLMFFVPLYLRLSGLDATQVGLLMTPEPIGGALGSLASGIIIHVTGTYGVLKIIVLILFIAGPTGFASSFLGTPVVLPEIYLFFTGFGYGAMLTFMLLAVLGAVEHHIQAIATGMQYAFRASGATIGISVAEWCFGWYWRQASLLTLHKTLMEMGSTRVSGTTAYKTVRMRSARWKCCRPICMLSELSSYLHWRSGLLAWAVGYIRATLNCTLHSIVSKQINGTKGGLTMRRD